VKKLKYVGGFPDGVDVYSPATGRSTHVDHGAAIEVTDEEAAGFSPTEWETVGDDEGSQDVDDS